MIFLINHYAHKETFTVHILNILETEDTLFKKITFLFK